jgi:Beta-lactamase enzyme family
MRRTSAAVALGLAAAVTAVVLASALPEDAGPEPTHALSRPAPVTFLGDGAQPRKAAAFPPRSHVRAARNWIRGRTGASFALIDTRGRVYGWSPRRRYVTASVVKAMLLVAYLRRLGGPPGDADRDVLGPMIRWSDNDTATRVLSIVGSSALYRLANRADFTHFRLRSPWGLTEITARDFVHFFYRIDRYVPARHRTYALNLLSRIVASQRWGIAPEKPPRWRIHFKGGWGSGTGWVTHQAALLRRGDKRLALAVFTRYNPSHSYGTRTIRGVASRFLGAPLPIAP